MESSTNDQNQYAGVILAAGEASRFGSIKPLVDWFGKPLIVHLSEIMLKADLWPVIVVVGAFSEQIQKSVETLPVVVVRNDIWQRGMLTSLMAGLSEIPTSSHGFVMALGDHPYLEKSIIEQLIQKSEKGDVIIPIYQGSRGHPVLWNTSSLVSILERGVFETPRDVLNALNVFEVNWQNRYILEDMDTPEEYERLLGEFSVFNR